MSLTDTRLCRSRWLLSKIGVPMWPGITTEIFTCGALTRVSMINASVKPLTANLAAAYADCGYDGPRHAQKPFTLLVLIRCASLAATSIGMNARVQKYTPFQHTANVRSQTSRESFRKLPPPPT